MQGSLLEKVRRIPSIPPVGRPRATIPSALVQAIDSGQCVAFLGAGFSAAAKLPNWKDMLGNIGDGALEGTEDREHLHALLKTGGGHSLEQAAQFLHDRLGSDGFLRRVDDQLRPAETDAIVRRLWYLLRIPFRAVLTTNFDTVLPGRLPECASYTDVLRSPPRRWWDKAFWAKPDTERVVKLHGDLSTPQRSVVLTNRDYRARLYESSKYANFLRATLASSTILYLGFSFDDVYFTELRSEVLAMLRDSGDARKKGGRARGSAGSRRRAAPAAPLAFALLPRASPQTVEHFGAHEGIEVTSYHPHHNHIEFDRFLEGLYLATNPLPRFADILGSRRILWVDPNHNRNNRPGVRFLRRAAELAENELAIEHADSADEALAKLTARSGPPFDVVITHWGQRLRTAERLLAGVRKADLRVPVVVFAGPDHDGLRSAEAIRRGATGYFWRWGDLFQELARVFAALGSARAAGYRSPPDGSDGAGAAG